LQLWIDRSAVVLRMQPDTDVLVISINKVWHISSAIISVNGIDFSEN
jgi:hypothetical protein